MLQHTVEHEDAICPFVQILDALVPEMGEQLVDVLRFFDTLLPVADQVIDAPKITLEDIPARRLCREPQLVEQLAEAPTILYFQFLVVEGDSQIVKVLTLDRVQQRRSLPSRSLTFQFTVEDFKVLAQDRIRQRHLLLSLQLVRMMTRMSLVKVFFCNFPRQKKCEGHPALECESFLARQLTHAERSSNGSRQLGSAWEPG